MKEWLSVSAFSFSMSVSNDACRDDQDGFEQAMRLRKDHKDPDERMNTDIVLLPVSFVEHATNVKHKVRKEKRQDAVASLHSGSPSSNMSPSTLHPPSPTSSWCPPRRV